MNTLTDPDGRFMFIILWQTTEKSKVYLMSKTKPGTSQLSSILPSAHEVKPSLGKQKETSQSGRQDPRIKLKLQTSPSRRKTPNPRIHTHEQTEPTTCSFHTHETQFACTEKENN